MEVLPKIAYETRERNVNFKYLFSFFVCFAYFAGKNLNRFLIVNFDYFSFIGESTSILFRRKVVEVVRCKSDNDLL